MKAPKFPSYDEAVIKKKSNKTLLTKEEWLNLEETKLIKQKEKEREKHKRCSKNRKRPVTIAFRTSTEDRDLIFEKIRLSGLQRQDYMTKAILNAPIEVVATRKVIDYCKEELNAIQKELERLKSFDELPRLSQEKLNNILEVIKAANKEKAPK